MTEWRHDRAANCQSLAESGARFVIGALDIPGIIYLYRFEDRRVASFNPYKYEWGNDDEWDFREEVHIKAYVAKKTPCGWTINALGNKNRFVPSNATKMYACPTVKDALESFVARKKRQAKIFRSRADRADRAIAIATGESLVLPWELVK